MPYIGVFFAFVVYPVFYGLWMGSDLSLYAEVFSDPIYQSTVVNTMLFLAFGVNLKLFFALCCRASSCARAGGSRVYC